jgi:hypothetical protein
LAFSGLHDVISQKIELFITTAVRTLNPAYTGILQSMKAGDEGREDYNIMFNYVRKKVRMKNED